jgi:hypothetical protein
VFIKARGDVSAQAFATEGMSTRIRTSNRIIGHLQTYAAHERSLARLGKLLALCRERAVQSSLIKSVLQVRITYGILSSWSEGGVGGCQNDQVRDFKLEPAGRRGTGANMIDCRTTDVVNGHVEGNCCVARKARGKAGW